MEDSTMHFEEIYATSRRKCNPVKVKLAKLQSVICVSECQTLNNET